MKNGGKDAQVARLKSPARMAKSTSIKLGYRTLSKIVKAFLEQSMTTTEIHRGHINGQSPYGPRKPAREIPRGGTRPK